MAQEVRQIKVAKCQEKELDEVRIYLQNLEEVITENDCYDEDDVDVNKQIADVARKYPRRAFIVPLNLGILLDNYQDKDSDILKHPKWINDMYNVIEDIDKYLSEDPKNSIDSGSFLHNKIKDYLAGDNIS